jgi:hypothetical protein
MLRRVLGSQRETEISRIMNNELPDLYSSSKITVMIKSSRMRWARYLACMGKREMQILVRRLEGKKPFSRPRCGWEANINGS